MEVGPNPSAQEHKFTNPAKEQTLRGYILDGLVSAKLSIPAEGQLALKVLSSACSVDEYHLELESVTAAIKACEEWRHPPEGLHLWKPVEGIRRMSARQYKIECQEGPASLSVKGGDVTLYLPGTIRGTTGQIYHGWVSDR